MTESDDRGAGGGAAEGGAPQDPTRAQHADEPATRAYTTPDIPPVDGYTDEQAAQTQVAAAYSQTAVGHVGPSPQDHYLHDSTQQAQYPPAEYPPADYPPAPYSPAQYPSAPYSPAQYPSAPYPPAQYPPAQYPVTGQPGRQSNAVPIALGVVIVLLLAVAGGIAWVLLGDDDTTGNDTAGPATQTHYVTPDGDDPAASQVAVSPVDQLRNQAQQDHGELSGGLNNTWTAQLSAKQPGLFAENRVWSESDILAEHEQLRSRFPQARLLWSTDWPVFTSNGWWITVMAGDFAGPEAANAWCRSNGFDPEHCFAKLVRTSGGTDGTTVYWK
ncbi:hypothetical protein GOHSU_14_00980 [Gordonia hirsuta DSM 44140 = NBRC 16056]|uniref:Uncharacterized protein n=1 Tax=Gordonia hirsuta DSM 44140 = NBRC 16056 TaxID=1121927 RepID=L7L859_9ACTN|nr:hypothetical protein [Gordonia hirsuta]GAC56931.1 hypothetical protein GOHSU_14_00980 [Gordonia hirsuta DSM 44140 = NBRC 16056]